jgi:hypothetical protein
MHSLILKLEVEIQHAIKKYLIPHMRVEETQCPLPLLDRNLAVPLDILVLLGTWPSYT